MMIVAAEIVVKRGAASTAYQVTDAVLYSSMEPVFVSGGHHDHIMRPKEVMQFVRVVKSVRCVGEYRPVEKNNDTE